MHRLLVAFIVFLSAVCARAEEPASRHDSRDGAAAATRGAKETEETDVYIPKDIEDAFKQLDEILSAEDRAKLKSGEVKPVELHFGLGMWMRNNWGLWHGSRLAKYFNGLGIQHPDDMSGIILDSYVRRLQGAPIDLDGQIAGYKEYWRKVEEADRAEQQRVARAKERIREAMLGAKVVGEPVRVKFPTVRTTPQVRVRYMARFGDRVIIGQRQHVDSRDENSYYTRPLLLEPGTLELRPIELGGTDRVENGIVLGARAYFHGVLGTRDVLVSWDGTAASELPAPPGTGWLRLGTTGDGKLLAVRATEIFILEGNRWRSIHRSKSDLPKSAVPPRKIDNRVYLRDEGSGENMKQLWWVELDESTLVSFEEHLGLVGPEGPRWEMVWAYAKAPDGHLWLAVGEHPNGGGLLRWSPDEGYRIATFEGSVEFGGELIGNRRSKHEILITAITFDEPGSLLCAGPGGLYRLDQDRIERLAEFEGAVQDIPSDEYVYHWRWDPDQVLLLGGGRILVGGHFGGLFLFDPDEKGAYRVKWLDEKLGPPVKLPYPT